MSSCVVVLAVIVIVLALVCTCSADDVVIEGCYSATGCSCSQCASIGSPLKWSKGQLVNITRRDVGDIRVFLRLRALDDDEPLPAFARELSEKKVQVEAALAAAWTENSDGERPGLRRLL